MLTRSAKAAFYSICGPLMSLNGWIWRTCRTIKPGTNGIRVHLGPGQENYLDGWINVDANMFTGRCDMWLDLRNRLPFSDDAVDAAYSHHVIEHLPELRRHFADVFRILKPGGVYRVGGPNGDSAVRKFTEGDIAWFPVYPDEYTSLGGRFVNFVFCRNEHLTMLTESMLGEVAQSVGFLPGQTVAPIVSSGYPEIFEPCMKLEYESTPDCPHTLLMEFRKPDASVVNKTA